MPELPEIQAHAERLTDAYAGAVLTRFTALSFTALKTAAPSPDDAIGTPLQRVGRRGKYLLVDFEPATFVIHLMQGGRLKVDEKASAKPRGGLARWTFDDDHHALLLTEAGKEHRAGIWVIAGEPESQPPVERLGPDADVVSVEALAEICRSNSMRIHTLLRDQRIIAGIGRRLSNEVCHAAQISPFTNAKKLTDDEVVALHGAIASCIDESLAYERTRDDMSSSKDRVGSVHHRVGEACPTCGDTIRSVSYNAYTVAYCPTCQTGGKALADNTTSKFLK